MTMTENQGSRMPRRTFSAVREAFIESITADIEGAALPEIIANDADEFCAKLVATLNRCTEDNVEACAKFIKRMLFASLRRAHCLMVFLVDTAKLLSPRNNPSESLLSQSSGLKSATSSTRSPKRRPPIQSKRWHLLIVLDAAIKAYLHGRPNRSKYAFIHQILPQLEALVCIAAYSDSPPPQGLTTAQARLQNMITTWAKLFPSALSRLQIPQLRAAAVQGQSMPSWRALMNVIALREKKQIHLHPFADDPDWKMPATHSHPGAESVPDFELPAANGLFMKRVHGWPIQSRALPEWGYQLSSAGKEVDKELLETVEDMYSRALRCFDKHTDADEVNDIDAMGNIIWNDETRPTTTHWGWPIRNVEKRKQLAQQFHKLAVGYAGVQSRPPPSIRGSAQSYRSRGDYGGYRGGGPRNAQRFDIQADIARAQRLATGQGGAPSGFAGSHSWGGNGGRGGSYRGRGNSYSRGGQY